MKFAYTSVITKVENQAGRRDSILNGGFFDKSQLLVQSAELQVVIFDC